MQSKWLAPACYVGVAALCALYLAIVPGVTFSNVAAGAGIGAALMWAINEWETGKWTLTRAVQPTAANVVVQSATATEQTPVVQQTVAPATTDAPAQAAIVEAVQSEPAKMESVRIAPPPATSESWKIDSAEPSWDPSSLAETWAQLRRELAINGSSSRSAPPAPDLPRTAQLARESQLAKAKLPGLAARQAASRPTELSWTSQAVNQPTSATTPQRKVASASPKTAKEAHPPQRSTQSQPSFLRASTMRPR